MVQKSREKSIWHNLARPIFALAPMAGITNQPFRLICKEHGADMLFSEMISSEALWFNTKSKFQSSNIKQNPKPKAQIIKTLELIRFSQKEQPFIVQIFGANPEHLAYAAEYIASGQWAKDYYKIKNLTHSTSSGQELKIKNSSIPDGIDVNMGCPVRDIIKQGAGAALIKNPQLAGKIIKTIKKKIKIPLSVKTRIGWQNSKDILKFSRTLECAGADAITIHGRTYKQGFSGPVDWPTIYKVKKQLKIPVIGNGGINNNFQLPISNVQLLDGYMIGQGALGNPWIFRKLKTQILNFKSNNQKLTVKSISLEERKKVISEHAKLVIKIQGERGIREFRKHLLWYFKGILKNKKIRQKMSQIDSFAEIEDILDNLTVKDTLRG